MIDAMRGERRAGAGTGYAYGFVDLDPYDFRSAGDGFGLGDHYGSPHWGTEDLRVLGPGYGQESRLDGGTGVPNPFHSKRAAFTSDIERLVHLALGIEQMGKDYDFDSYEVPWYRRLTGR